MDLLPALERLEDEFKNVEQQLTTPEVLNDPARLRDLSVRHSELVPAMEKLEYREHPGTRDDAAAMLERTGPRNVEFLEAELEEAEAAIEEMRADLLVPSCRPTRCVTATQSWRSGPGPVAMRSRCSRATCSTYLVSSNMAEDIISANEGQMGECRDHLPR